MFRPTSTFDKFLEKATSNLLLEPDWPSIIQICDLIRQNDVQPKYAVTAIRKKLFNPNPHCAMFALQVLESVVKNCGTAVHEELTTRANCEMLRELAKTSTHENVRNKVLELIQAWTFAFRRSPKYRALKGDHLSRFPEFDCDSGKLIVQIFTFCLLTYLWEQHNRPRKCNQISDM